MVTAAAQLDSGLLDALPDAVLQLRDARVEWANRAAEKLWGLARPALIGRSLEDLLAPGEVKRLEALETQRREGWKLPETFGVRVRRGDGHLVSADARLGERLGGPGRRLLVTLRETTERRNAEALIEQLAELSGRSAGMLEAEAVLDRSGPIFAALGWTVAFTEVRGEWGRVTRVVGSLTDSPIADYGRSLLGQVLPLPRFPLVGAVLASGQPLFLDNLPGFEENLEALIENMSRARTSRSAWIPIRAEEATSYVLTVAGPSLSEHDFVAVQLFAAQLSAALRMKRLREEMVRRERLAAVGEMSAVLAHEVRNPLGVIFNALGSLRRLVPTTGDTGSLMEILGEEAERLQRLMHDLLDFAKPSEPTLMPVRLETVVREALEAARQDPACPAAKARVSVEVPDALPLVVADPALLRQALVNVLVNAFQHTAPAGEIRVQALAAPDDQVRLRVANDGPPIPGDIGARIFEPFFTTRATGSGLGLAVVRRIAEAIQARVELDPGPEVCFSLWLKVATPTAPV